MKHLRLYLITLLTIIGVTTLMAQEPYAALSSDGTELTFYYDNNRMSHSTTFDVPWTSSRPEWTHITDITTVDFHDSFTDYDGLTTARLMFCGMEKLTTINNLSRLNTANITDMSGMFCGCKSLTSLDLSNFNTTNVTNMGSMFFDCETLETLDVTSFNTANVTNMGDMFSWCLSLKNLDLSGFNTANVTYMGWMFYNCSELGAINLSNFNTTNVKKMYNMFCEFPKLTVLNPSSFNTANVKDIVLYWDNFTPFSP
ncbi:MAG: BspA family leucine-rich repeat surface protein [Prevotella sp.]|nr:BspA family leucine-rich repeat surface protein [Prevotella sp.]